MAVNKTVIGVIAGAVVLGVGGIWGWAAAQDEARKKVRDFVLDNDLEDHVRYSDVSYSPLSGELVIHDVRVSDEDDAPRIKQAVIYGVEESDNEDIPREISLALQGVEFGTKQVAEINREAHTGLVSLGYQDLTGDLRFEFARDSEARELSLHLAASIPKLGEVGFSGKLVNIDVNDFSGGDTQQMIGNPLMLLGLLQRSLGDLAIADLNLEYKDYGLIKRYKLVEDARSQNWPDEPSRWDNLEEQREELIRDLKKSGLSGAQAGDIADALIAFVESPDVIRFRTDMDRPLKIQKLFSSKKNPLDTFLQLANAKVESN